MAFNERLAEDAKQKILDELRWLAPCDAIEVLKDVLADVECAKANYDRELFGG